MDARLEIAARLFQFQCCGMETDEEVRELAKGCIQQAHILVEQYDVFANNKMAFPK